MRVACPAHQMAYRDIGLSDRRAATHRAGLYSLPDRAGRAAAVGRKLHSGRRRCRQIDRSRSAGRRIHAARFRDVELARRRRPACVPSPGLQVARQIPGSVIGVRDADGRILLATSRPPGFVFGDIDPVLKAADEEALSRRGPVVTNLYKGATTKGATTGAAYVNVQAPVFTTGQSYVLSLALTSDSHRRTDETAIARPRTGSSPSPTGTTGSSRVPGRTAASPAIRLRTDFLPM